MKFSISSFCAGLSTITLVSTASPASAFIAGLSLTGGQQIYVNYPWTLGWEFNVNKVIKIDALGIFDSDAPGLNGTYALGLWDSSQNLLASTTVSGFGDGIQNGFAWKSLASVLTLTPGDYLVGAAGDYLGNGDRYAYDGTFNAFPGVTFLRSKYIFGSFLQYPDRTGNTRPGFLGGNFSVDEVPGPLPLFGVAAAFGWTRRLRTRVKQASASLRHSAYSEAV